MLRQGSGEPLVLLHGVLCGERIWSRVVPLLADNHDVIVPTALGHNGGSPAKLRPMSFEHIVDDAEGILDEMGLEKVHLAGNSMGGWMALELARRGRALTVCALSPAGMWDLFPTDKQRVFKMLHEAVRDTRRSSKIMPLVVRSKSMRHWILRNVAVNGERVSPAELIAMGEDTVGCQYPEDLLASNEEFASMDPPPCPITLAWSGQDRLFPVNVYGVRARQLIPGARFTVFGDIGHIPMLDDPQLVAQTILTVTGAGLRRDPADEALLPSR